jgi:hypothetical protein
MDLIRSVVVFDAADLDSEEGHQAYADPAGRSASAGGTRLARRLPPSLLNGSARRWRRELTSVSRESLPGRLPTDATSRADVVPGQPALARGLDSLALPSLQVSASLSDPGKEFERIRTPVAVDRQSRFNPYCVSRSSPVHASRLLDRIGHVKIA